MMISTAFEMLKELNRLKSMGGKKAKKIDSIFSGEATTSNLNKAASALRQMKEK